MLAGVGGGGGAEQLRRQLTVGGGDVDDLVAVLLHSPGLVDADVGCGGGNHRLIGPQESGNGRLIGLGPAHQEVDGGLRPAAEAADPIRCVLAIGVCAITGGQLQIGPAQGLQYLRMGPGAVVVAKMQHGMFSFSLFLV